MATTEKISLSLDTGALFLARRAAEIDGLSLSAWMSRLVRRHAWESQRPRLTAEQQHRADEQIAAADAREEAQHGEVAALPVVRDSKNPAGPALTFTPAEWTAFTAGIRTGEFG